MFPCMPKKLQNHKMTKKMYCIVIKEGVRKKKPEELCPIDKYKFFWFISPQKIMGQFFFSEKRANQGGGQGGFVKRAKFFRVFFPAPFP